MWGPAQRSAGPESQLRTESEGEKVRWGILLPVGGQHDSGSDSRQKRSLSASSSHPTDRAIPITS